MAPENALAAATVRLIAQQRKVSSAVALMTSAGLAPDPWQVNVLTSTAQQMLMLCSRQSGKSSVTAALAAHTALHQPGSLVLLLSPGERQSKELFRKMIAFFRGVNLALPPLSETVLSLELPNGSRVVALPGKEGTIRGYSGVALLVADEAGFVEDALYLAIRPMLAVSHGRFVGLGTPHGNRGWFYEAWEHGGDAWERHMITATECPRITPQFLEAERRAMGEFAYSQEYECQFLDSESHAFTRDDISAAFSEEIETWTL